MLYVKICLLLLQQSKTKTITVQNILQNNLKGACGVVPVSLLQNIQCGLSLARWRSALCISCMFGQRAVFETRRTPVETQFTTINENNFWSCGDLKLNLMLKRLFLIHFCLRRFVSAYVHNVTAASFPDFPNYGAG